MPSVAENTATNTSTNFHKCHYLFKKILLVVLKPDSKLTTPFHHLIDSKLLVLGTKVVGDY